MSIRRSRTQPYEKGRGFEYKVKRHLEGVGYTVFRSGGSRGPADLVAIKRDEVLLIQCRLHGYLNPKRRERLRVLAGNLGARAILAYREGRRLTLEVIWGGGGGGGR
ncbi:hypothetical protein KEJ13_09075 [Candidatus Bathyarchaeota archaeon]|nr:hypothetical protein [Candidatus Bathyarchaeota archaeon]